MIEILWQLIELAIADAFDELVREHRSSLLAHARRKLRCDAASEDALQETLVRAYKALPRFNGEYRLGPWLHRIMHNVCIDEANRRRRDGEKVDLYVAQGSWSAETQGVEEELGFEFDDSSLRAALESLSEPYRQALELKFLREYDYSELAEASGVSEQNARARVSRAKAVMRSALKGVASLPLLLVGILKRGEKAAAAAATQRQYLLRMAQLLLLKQQLLRRPCPCWLRPVLLLLNLHRS